MAEVLFRGIVKAGQFRPDDMVRWAAKLGRLEGKRVQCAVKKEKTGRTLSQNRYLWGVVYATLSEWSGHEPEELHRYLTGQFLPMEEKRLPSGVVMAQSSGTSGLTVEQFSQYVDRVVRWAADQGVYVPSAEEVVNA